MTSSRPRRRQAPRPSCATGSPDGLPPEIAARCVVTADSTEALGAVGAPCGDPPADLTVIGVTGSQGKTSTKDLLAQVLEREGPTIAPPAGNFNNEIGAPPLTACRCDETTRYLVAEMGGPAGSATSPISPGSRRRRSASCSTSARPT